MPCREAVSSRTPLCRGTAPWRLPRPEGERGARHVLPGVPGALQHRHQGLGPVSAGAAGKEPGLEGPWAPRGPLRARSARCVKARPWPGAFSCSVFVLPCVVMLG